METALVDHKNNYHQIDVYDLSNKKPDVIADRSSQSSLYESKPIGFRQARDAQVGTSENKTLLSSRDWFFSDIHRRLLVDHYLKTN